MNKANIFVLIKTSSEDEDERHFQDVFKTSLRRLQDKFCWDISFILEANSKRPNDFSLVLRKPNEILQSK